MGIQQRGSLTPEPARTARRFRSVLRARTVTPIPKGVRAGGAWAERERGPYLRELALYLTFCSDVSKEIREPVFSGWIREVHWVHASSR